MPNNKEKDWNETATDMMNTWTQTGTKMWQSWFELMGNVPNTQIPETTPEDLKKATQRFFDDRDILVKFIKLSVNAWQEIFPKIETGEGWLTIVEKYTNQMREQLDDFTKGSLGISKNNAQLWQLYLEETQKFNQLWLNPFSFSFNNLAQGNHSNALIELNNLYWNLLYEESFGSLMKSPILGPTREFTGKLLNGFDAWSQLYRASLDYQIVLGDIQVKSFEALMKALVNKAEKGETIEDWKQFQALWSQIADDVFAEAFCEEKNLKIRGKFLNALNLYRIEQHKLLEQSLQMMNLPTRSEIDELHKTVYELKKEIKTLKKQLS
jgi:polyhydroxyalkanoate synthase subunit PhaE